MNLNELSIEYLTLIKYSVKERTLLNYQQMINRYIKDDEIAQIEIKNLDNNLLNEFLLSKYKKGLSCGTLKILKTIINKLLNFAYEKNYTSKYLKITISFKQESIQKIESLNTVEVKKLETYILEHKKYYSYGVLISLYTGLRIGELLALKWENIDFTNKVMTVTCTVCDMFFENKSYHLESTPKSDSSLREIPLTNELISLLKDLRNYQQNKSEYVVSRPNGKRLLLRSYQDSFSRLLKKLNIRHYGFHSLRHTFATRCYHLGMDIKTLSELLGHSSPAITLKIYVHTDLDTKRNALNKITKKYRQNV